MFLNRRKQRLKTEYCGQDRNKSREDSDNKDNKDNKDNMNILVSGGAKNGKSMFAQKKAKQMAEENNLPLFYVATMIPHDDEDEERIARHRKEREGWGFQTLECGRGLTGIICPEGVFLIDSVTALLSNEMFREDGSVDMDAPERVAEDCVVFAKATKNAIFVSDYIYGDMARYDKLTEEYRHGLAMIDRRLAEICDRVVEVSAGVISEWKDYRK